MHVGWPKWWNPQPEGVGAMPAKPVSRQVSAVMGNGRLHRWTPTAIHLPREQQHSNGNVAETDGVGAVMITGNCRHGVGVLFTIYIFIEVYRAKTDYEYY